MTTEKAPKRNNMPFINLSPLLFFLNRSMKILLRGKDPPLVRGKVLISQLFTI